MDYAEPQPTYQYENHAAYSVASKKAVEGFSKFINPFDSPDQNKPLFSKENALRVATNIATRGQGDVLKSSVNSVFDAGVSMKDHLSQAKVVAVNNQELGEAKPSDRDQLAALNDVSKELNKKGNEENQKRFDQSLSNAGSCLDNNGYVDVKDPSKNLNEEIDGKYFTDVKIANGISNVTTAAATLTTGFFGGVAASYVIDNQKEKYVNNSRMDKYIQSTEDMLSSCKHFESSGILYENGKVVSMNRSTSKEGNDFTKVDVKYNEKGEIDRMDMTQVQKSNSAIIPTSQEKFFDSFQDELSASLESQVLKNKTKLSR
jgi:hypothetical protein